MGKPKRTLSPIPPMEHIPLTEYELYLIRSGKFELGGTEGDLKRMIKRVDAKQRRYNEK